MQCLTSALFNQSEATFFGSSGTDAQLSCIIFPNEGHLKPETVSEHNTVLSFHDGLTRAHTHTQKYSEYFSLADKLGHRAKEIKANRASLSTGTLCLLPALAVTLHGS